MADGADQGGAGIQARHAGITVGAREGEHGPVHTGSLQLLEGAPLRLRAPDGDGERPRIAARLGSAPPQRGHFPGAATGVSFPVRRSVTTFTT